jgi:hypothetical protein
MAIMGRPGEQRGNDKGAPLPAGDRHQAGIAQVNRLGAGTKTPRGAIGSGGFGSGATVPGLLPT